TSSLILPGGPTTGRSRRIRRGGSSTEVRSGASQTRSWCTRVTWRWRPQAVPPASQESGSRSSNVRPKLSRDCRRIVASGWYRHIFPTRLSQRHQAVPEFDTTARGCRLATSVGGVLTGRGADIIIIDDPLKPEEALSQAQREAANEWFDHTLYSRLNDKQKGAIILIMHRLHEDDLVGHVLAQEDWEVVRFPAIAEADETHRVETVWGPQ